MDLARDINKAYQELDLTPGASLHEVKNAYRRLARALHPDLNPGAMGALMGRVNQAYEKLVHHLEGQHPHQAGPASAAKHTKPDQGNKQSNSRSGQDGYSTYKYEEFNAERGAHGEHARRYSAWQELKRRFYDQARKAAEAAAQTAEKSREAGQAQEAPRAASKAGNLGDEAQVISPSDPRVSTDPAQETPREEPVAGPMGLERQPEEGWRLLGLAKQDGMLLYRVELAGRPALINLPVRCCRPCSLCQGTGRHGDASGRLHRCPACGGRGRIARADRVPVELPRDWRPGQRIQVPACDPDSEILVELNPAQA